MTANPILVKEALKLQGFDVGDCDCRSFDADRSKPPNSHASCATRVC